MPIVIIGLGQLIGKKKKMAKKTATNGFSGSTCLIAVDATASVSSAAAERARAEQRVIKSLTYRNIPHLGIWAGLAKRERDTARDH